MSDTKATVRSAIIQGITKHCLETGLVMGATTDMLIEDIIVALFDKPVRWAVIAYADECYAMEDE